MKKITKIVVFLVVMALVASLVVACTPTKYTVTFDADGGAPVPEAQQIEKGGKVTKPTDPTKSGYTFAGWYNGDTKYEFTETVESDLTLKAKWTAEQPEPSEEKATTQEITYTSTAHTPVKPNIKLSLVYGVDSHKIYEVKIGEGSVFTTGGGFETTWTAGMEKAVAAYVGKTTEEVLALTAPAGDMIVTGTTQSSNALLAAIKMAIGTIGSGSGTWTINSTTGELTAYDGTDAVVEIPSKVDDVTVVKLGDGLFENNTKVTKVTIPATVTTVSAGAFSGASNLTEVVFAQGSADTAVMIQGSFQGLTKLSKVTLPSKFSLMPSAFEGCTALATVENLDKALVIQNRAFFGCTSLKSATITATMIGESAFEGCTALQQVTINAGSFMTMSAKYIFKGCASLTSFEVPAVVTELSATSFQGCSKLTFTVADGNTKFFAQDGVLYKGTNNLFLVPGGVKTFEIPATITNIGNRQEAFLDAYNVESITVNSENKSFVADNGVLYTTGYTKLEFVPSSVGPTFEIRPETTGATVMAFAHSTGIEKITVNEGNTSFKIFDNLLYYGTSSYYLVTVADRTVAKEVTILEGNEAYTLSSVMDGVFDHGKITGIIFRNANHVGTGWASVEIPESMTIKATSACQNKINSNMTQYKDRVQYID